VDEVTGRWLPTAFAALAVVVAVAVVVAGFGGFVAAAPAGGAPVAVSDEAVAHHPKPEGDAEPETRLVQNGSTVNANTDSLPPGCDAVRGERHLTVDAGREYADAGDAYGYDLDSVTVPACTRLVVTLVNHDDVRHQWVVDGLPTATYPGGYAGIEVAERGSVTAAIVTPSQPGTYEGLSTLPQHEQNGMRLPLVVTGDESTEATTQTTDTDSDQSEGTVPGFGPLLALLAFAGVAAAALLAVRR
jgi:hypothetical protein